jgi:hypothetical protein
VAEGQQVEGGEAAEVPVAASGQQVVQGGREGEQQRQTAEQPVARSEAWTRTAEAPEAHAEQPVVPAAQGQSGAGTNSRAAKEEAARAAQAAGDVAPVRASSPKKAAETARAGRQDPAQRTGQHAAKSSKDTGRGN